MRVEAAEVRPGLVVHLDPAALRQGGGCVTNAERTGNEDRAVQGEHEFLVLMVDDVDKVALAVPLFSAPAPGNELLDDTKKGGMASGWIGPNLRHHFSRWQHWWIPLSVIEDASDAEWTDPATRHTYAEGDQETLGRIADWRLRNRAEWRAV